MSDVSISKFDVAELRNLSMNQLESIETELEALADAADQTACDFIALIDESNTRKALNAAVGQLNDLLNYVREVRHDLECEREEAMVV